MSDPAAPAIATPVLDALGAVAPPPAAAPAPVAAQPTVAPAAAPPAPPTVNPWALRPAQPAAPAGNDRGYAPVRLGIQGLLETTHVVVQAKLQHVVDAAARLRLDLGELVQVPRADDERLLADGVSPQPQREAAVRVVQIVGRADRDELDGLVGRARESAGDPSIIPVPGIILSR